MKYRDDVPLSEKEFAEIRANVMARVSFYRGWHGREVSLGRSRC